jgi:hypothetical protein
MKYYKLIKELEFIGISTTSDMRRFQEKHKLLLSCKEAKAQYIECNGALYHANWMLTVSTDAYEYETVSVVQIEKEEYWSQEKWLYYAPDCPSPFTPIVREGEKGIYRTPDTNKILWNEFVVSGEYHTIGAGALMSRNNHVVYVCEGVKRIEAGAFTFLDTMHTVYLPSTLEYLSPNAFIECDALPPEMIPEKFRTPPQKQYTATLDIHCEEWEEGSSYRIKKDQTIKLDGKRLGYRISSTEYRLLELTADHAVVFLSNVDMPVTIPVSTPVTFTFGVRSNGAIIEGSRYYECDDNYEYTFTLSHIEPIQ